MNFAKSQVRVTSATRSLRDDAQEPTEAELNAEKRIRKRLKKGRGLFKNITALPPCMYVLLFINALFMGKMCKF